MILLPNIEPAFTKMILEQIPRIAQIPLVRAAMKKYTSGYLTGKRLDAALSLAKMPMVLLADIGGGDGGDQAGDLIRIDSSYFKGYKEAHPNYLKHVPITVFHELGHWGYRKGQDEGHSSDKFGRAHNNHGENLSPLSSELQNVFDLINQLAILRL